MEFLWKDLNKVQEDINRSPYYEMISMRLEETNKEGSNVRVKSGHKHLNLSGTVHGGVIASLLDSTCGLSIVPFFK